MTPPASAAARSSSRGTSQRSKVGQGRTVVKHHRRVSGPARSASVALPLPGIALPRARPVRPQAPSRRRGTRTSGAVEAPGLLLRARDGLHELSGNVLLDRLLRGRIWIGLLAFALIGIVAMQLFVLELNTGVGRTLRREAQLQRENAQIGIEDSMASAGGRVEPLAAATGMTIAAPGSLHFVAANAADIGRAAAALGTAVSAQASTGSAEASSAFTEAGSTASASGSTSGGSSGTESAATSQAATSEAASSSSSAGDEASPAAVQPTTETGAGSSGSSSESPSTPVAQGGGASAAPASAASTSPSAAGAAQASTQE